MGVSENEGQLPISWQFFMANKIRHTHHVSPFLCKKMSATSRPRFPVQENASRSVGSRCCGYSQVAISKHRWTP